MDRARFNQALNVTSMGLILTDSDKKFIECVFRNPGILAHAANSVDTEIQALVAALVAVSQPDGNVILVGPSNRTCQEFITSADGWLNNFKTSAEFGYNLVKLDSRECITIETTFTQTTSTITAVSGMTDPSNLRGMGKNLKLLIIATAEPWGKDHPMLPTLLPLLVNGAQFVVCRV